MNYAYNLCVFTYSNTLYKVKQCLWYCFIQFITSLSYQSIHIVYTNNGFTPIWDKNELFIYFCKLVTLYLNESE